MDDFFKGWRRKAGCVALVMALTLLGLWIRSHLAIGAVPFPVGDRQNTVVSVEGRLIWLSWSKSALSAVNSGTSPYPIEREWALWGDLIYKDSGVGFIASVPYWSVSIPLTLLSVMLILWPRKRREKLV